MEIVIKDLATGEVIGTIDHIPEFTAEPQVNEVIGGIDLATGSSFTGEFKLNWLDVLSLVPSKYLTNNYLKYHGRPMLRRKHLRRERLREKPLKYFCSVCGNEVGVDDEYCSYCGQHFSEEV